MLDRHEVQMIAILFGDGCVGRMQFVTRAWKSTLGVDSQSVFQRAASDEEIEKEIAATVPAWEKENAKALLNGQPVPFSLPLKGWRRALPDDFPSVESPNRDAWRDDGKTIAVDQTKLDAPRRRINRRTIIERLDAVGLLDEAEAALLKAPTLTRWKWNTALEGVYFDDEETVAFLTAVGAKPDEILAP